MDWNFVLGVTAGEIAMGVAGFLTGRAAEHRQLQAVIVRQGAELERLQARLTEQSAIIAGANSVLERAGESELRGRRDGVKEGLRLAMHEILKMQEAYPDLAHGVAISAKMAIAERLKHL